ncbi:MAG: hypothetical protein AABY32_02630 [Nanoarchaeota archaeon]
MMQLIVIVILIGFLLGLFLIRHEEKLWNDGYCKCGGEWIVVRNMQTNMYRCSKCNLILITITEK